MSILAASGPPTLTSVVNIGILQIQVTWTAPAQPNGSIVDYEVSTTTDKAHSLVTYRYIGLSQLFENNFGIIGACRNKRIIPA